MKKAFWLSLVVIILLSFAGCSFNERKDDGDNDVITFEPTITQGIYGTAMECHGSAEPPATGDWNTVQISFYIKNEETGEIIDVETDRKGNYEIELPQGAYDVYVPIDGEEDRLDAKYSIEKDTLIKRNIVIKFCPV